MDRLKADPGKLSLRFKSAFEKIDSLRFWAANGVVLVHFLEVFLVRKTGFDQLNGLGTWECWLGWFCVGLFFIMSGFVISFSIQNAISKGKDFNLIDFYKKRIFRIYPVAWGSLGVSLIAYLLIQGFNLYGHDSGNLQLPGDLVYYSLYADLNSLLYSLFLPPSGYTAGFLNVALWSLSYEIAFYLVFGTFYHFWTRYSKVKVSMAISFALAGAFTWYQISTPFASDAKGISPLIHFLNFFPCWNFFAYFAIWLSGVHLQNSFRKNIPLHKTIKQYCLIIISLVLIGKLGGSPWNFNQYYRISDITAEPPFSIFLTIAYTIGIGLLFYIFISINKLKIPGQKITAKGGHRYSFTLYATHFTWIYLVFGIIGNQMYKYESGISMSIIGIGVFIISNSFAYFLAPHLENRTLWMNRFDSLCKKLSTFSSSCLIHFSKVGKSNSHFINEEQTSTSSPT